jgi:hypothetical protein
MVMMDQCGIQLDFHDVKSIGHANIRLCELQIGPIAVQPKTLLGMLVPHTGSPYPYHAKAWPATNSLASCRVLHPILFPCKRFVGGCHKLVQLRSKRGSMASSTPATLLFSNSHSAALDQRIGFIMPSQLPTKVHANRQNNNNETRQHMEPCIPAQPLTSLTWLLTRSDILCWKDGESCQWLLDSSSRFSIRRATADVAEWLDRCLK